MAIEFYFSGGGSEQSVLGGAKSSVIIPNLQGVIFPNITVAQSKAGIMHYAGIYVKNAGTVTKEIKLYFSSIVSSAKLYLADSITPALTITNSTTEPSDSLVFTSPTYEYSALSIGNLNAGESRLIWLKRVVNANSPGSLNDYFILNGIEE